MSLLAAIAVALRVCIILLALAMVIGWWRQCLAVILRKPGWRIHLSPCIVTVLAVAGGIGSSVNIYIDADWYIDPDVRLAISNIAQGLFCIGLLTSIYRRALRSGPEKARAALLSGVALMVPGAALVAVLAIGGANG